MGQHCKGYNSPNFLAPVAPWWERFGGDSGGGAVHVLKSSKRPEGGAKVKVFIAALLIIARTWKQPRCPSADEWIGKLWYIYTMEYYSAIKRN